MGCYKVNFGDYCVAHYDSIKHFDYFECNGKKYKIGSYVSVSENGLYDISTKHGLGYVKGGYRLVDHYITEKGIEKWEYIIGHLYDSTIPVFHSTTVRPEWFVSEVFAPEIDETTYTPGELKVEFNEPNYFPKDWEIDGLMFGWFVMIICWIGAFVLKDWWIRFAVQIYIGWTFGSWREKKINKAISTQKFKKNV